METINMENEIKQCIQQIKYAWFTACPIDYWEDFIHIKDLDLKVVDFIINNPRCDFTRSDVWRSVLDKLHWAWCMCENIDTDLRSPDIYIHLTMEHEYFEDSILFKSDNNGTVNLIMTNAYDVKQKAKAIPHEFQGEWELQE